MIRFYIVMVFLLFLPLFFVLRVLFKSLSNPIVSTRKGLNYFIYKRHLQELELECRRSLLTSSEFKSEYYELSTEVLKNTEKIEHTKSVRLGYTIPFVISLMIPILALVLYHQYGSLDQLKTILISKDSSYMLGNPAAKRREKTASQIKNYYLLARSYMLEGNPKEALKHFDYAISLAGRDPTLLANWAQAKYFANGKKWENEIQRVVNEVLEKSPRNPIILGLIGISAFEERKYDVTLKYWKILLDTLNKADPSREILQYSIQKVYELRSSTEK